MALNQGHCLSATFPKGARCPSDLYYVPSPIFHAILRYNLLRTTISLERPFDGMSWSPSRTQVCIIFRTRWNRFFPERVPRMLLCEAQLYAHFASFAIKRSLVVGVFLFPSMISGAYYLIQPAWEGGWASGLEFRRSWVQVPTRP